MDRTRRVFLAAGFLAVTSVLISGAVFFGAQFLLADAGTAMQAAQDQDIKEALPIFDVLPVSPSRVESVSLFMGGDVMLDRTVATRITRSGNDAYAFAKIASDARFTDPDLRVLNLEGPVTARRAPPEKEIDFQFDPRFASMLRELGVNAVSQANNHALDQGRAGAEESRRHLRDANIVVFGDEVREDPVLSFATTSVRGRMLAFVGFNETSDRIDDDAAEIVMTEARRVGDTVIVFMHWGEEYRNRPTKNQEVRARWLIDHGADIVIGAHPHWVQGISMYRGRPIIYSLGNLVFDQDWSVETRRGLTLGLRIADTGIAVDLYPVQIDLSQPRFVEGTERDERLNELAAVSDAALLSQIIRGEVFFPTP
ncbi:MAG: CapA family protein [Patescibacteria group bacterium]|jgi:poly-gamma-glutamate synthesis protein (capsule biosynthesis protein)